ncbi:MAG: hypothetical protein JO257_07440 [Deltaproteobacteria bacterium]|nr:hypothetical protein [Deltaproteobacteria bacterium]
MRYGILLLLAACSAAARVPPARFANAPAVDAVNDRLDVPDPPSKRVFFEHLYHYDGLVQRRMTRALELHPPTRARGTNALDEVPDSTWFTNRIGIRDLSLDEVRRGANRIDSPELHRPWAVKSTKTGGSEVGFIVVDSRGEKFLLKFDAKGVPEQETATHVIVGKILWSCGYNVTEDYIVHFRLEDLVLAKGAYIKDGETEAKRPLHEDELERRLAQIEREPDGSFRALASRWLPGQPLGGPPAEAVREDDPNDRIPHELRRDLRGFYSIAAWLDHEDIQESNFLDLWVADPSDAQRHYVKHYLIDFGKSLGVMATTSSDPRRGFEYWFDPSQMSWSLLTAGAVPRHWEQREFPRLRGVGAFGLAAFDPGDWFIASPAYVPFTTVDRYDAFWGAKIVMRFSREQLRAIISTGQLTDPRAADYLVDTLVARQRATGEYWFDRVNPLDRFEVVGSMVCFDDLALRYRFTGEITSYAVTTYDRQGHALGTTGMRAETARTCTPAVSLAPAGDSYRIVEITTQRSTFAGRTLVHMARDPATGGLRVIGVWRP